MTDTGTRQYVLRKSIGGHSAGTRVRMIEAAEDLQLQPGTVNPGYSRIELPNSKVIDIEFDYVVKLRNRSDVVPAVPRINRPDRLAKRQLWLMFNGAANA